MKNNYAYCDTDSAKQPFQTITYDELDATKKVLSKDPQARFQVRSPL